MFRKIFRKHNLLYTLAPLHFNTADIVSKETDTAKNADLTVMRQESGWNRIKSLFMTNEFNEVSPEVDMILRVVYLSSFVGALYGGILHSKDAYLDFMRKNTTTLFKNHYEAKRNLQDKVVIGFAKGAFKWSWRLTIFCTMYITTSTIVSTYRNKDGIVEHTLAGTVAGFLYKFHSGPKSWVVGGVLGGILGTIAGCCTSAILSLSGMSMEEARYWQSRVGSKRSESFKKTMAANFSENDPELVKERDAKIKHDIQKLEKFLKEVSTENDKINE